MYYNIDFTPIPSLYILSYALLDEMKSGIKNGFDVVLLMRIKTRLWLEFNFYIFLRMQRIVSLFVGLNKSLGIPNCVSNVYLFAEGYWV